MSSKHSAVNALLTCILAILPSCSEGEDSGAIALAIEHRSTADQVIGHWRLHIPMAPDTVGESTWNGTCLVYDIGYTEGRSRTLSCPKPGVLPAIADFLIAQEGLAFLDRFKWDSDGLTASSQLAGIELDRIRFEIDPTDSDVLLMSALPGTNGSRFRDGLRAAGLPLGEDAKSVALHRDVAGKCPAE